MLVNAATTFYIVEGIGMGRDASEPAPGLLAGGKPDSVYK